MIKDKHVLAHSGLASAGPLARFRVALLHRRCGAVHGAFVLACAASAASPCQTPVASRGFVTVDRHLFVLWLGGADRPGQCDLPHGAGTSRDAAHLADPWGRYWSLLVARGYSGFPSRGAQ